MSDKRNKFDVSKGNMLVLKTIPDMMEKEIWREKLRRLVLDFIALGDKDE